MNNTPPKPIQQYGALCFRPTIQGPEVLLITTRETKRWMIPKGWPIVGLKPRKVAELEAWEEAGIIGRAYRKPFGDFAYDKRMADGSEVRPVVAVFLLEVVRQRKRFPEMTERPAAWLSPDDAAHRVAEAGLERLILRFGHFIERL
ncbi:DNA mismatch repair protein MutT [Neorhizobium sp. P12A]|uniref:NUDIX hydrolase n=1 Tax=Neorhizobium sp. P12A TaxID=2268027 RepID=UPI0011F07C08|nr:NUDIX hydrolase [Neorhizobium sp. P12A]KAA0687373.1 DNA mismatch repair protein MutT [Neorhizobium sp. P12A]